jgi:hypothetical protein
VVAAHVRDGGSMGRSPWRPRTEVERSTAYAAALASVVLTAAKQVLGLALVTDDVNVVVVRPTAGGPGVEPIYVGRLDSAAVSLRHPEADPLPLVLSSAGADGIRLEGPNRAVTALADEAYADGVLCELVRACHSAEADTPVEAAV